MEWKEFRKTARFKYLEAKALEHSREIDRIIKTMEHECPLKEVGNIGRKHYYAITAGNKGISRFDVFGFGREP